MAEEIRGLSVKFDADFSEFKKGMKNADKDIASTQKELKSLQDSLKLKFDDSKFAQSQTKVRQALDATERKAGLLRSRLEQMDAAGVTEKTREEYNYLREQLAKTEMQALQLEQRLEDLDDIRLSNLTKGVDDFSSKMDRAAAATQGVSVAAGAVIAGVGALAVNSYSAVAEIDDLAQRSGLAAEKIQELQYVSTQTGVSTQKLVQALIKARATYADLGTGNLNKQTEALQALGVAYGKIEQDEIFEVIIDRLSKLDDETLQVAYANEIFGDKVAHELIPLLNAGEGAIAQFKDEFAGFDSLSDEQVSAMATMDDTLFRMKTRFQYLTMQLGVDLIPLFERLVAFLEEKVAPALSDIIDRFSELDSGTQDLLLVGLALLAGLSPILKLFSGIASLTSVVIKAFAKLDIATLKLYARWIPLVATVMTLFNVLNNWEKMNPVQKIIALLGLLSAAALSAAVAFGVFHSAWSLGLAVGGIVAGIVAATAAVKEAGKEIGSEVNFDPDSYTSAVANGGYDTSKYAPSTGDSYSNTTSNDTYNITVNVTEPAATPEEITDAVSKAIATIVQTRR